MGVSKEEYKQMVEKASPNSRIFLNCVKAFFSGGSICLLGQLLYGMYAGMGADRDMSGTLVAVSLVFIAVLLTGIGVYDDIVKFAGAGASVPITGFANAVAAPAIEFKKEGFILGVGAKMFLIAGPVIVYGTLASVLVGVIYYFVR